MDEIYKSLLEIMENNGVNPEEDNYIDNIDSIVYISMVVEIETKYNICFTENDMRTDLFEDLDVTTSIVKRLIDNNK